MNKLYFFLIPALLFLQNCKNNNEKSFANGNFEAEEIIVSAEVTGTIQTLNITEGLNLKKGRIVGYIDTTQLFLKKQLITEGINSVLSRINQVDEQLKVNGVNMKNTLREKNRLEALLKDNAITIKQFEDISGQVDLLNANTEVLKSQKASIGTEIKSLKVQITQLNDQLAHSYIKSPIDGVVLEKYLNSGELAVMGKSIFKIANINNLILRVFVEGDQLTNIKIGDTVKVRVDVLDGKLKEYTGSVSWVSSVAEFTPKIIQTRKERVNLVYAIKIIVPNDGALKIGMPAEISII